MIFGGVFSLFTIVKKKLPLNFGIKTKRLSEFSNLHALELSIGFIRVASIVPVAVR